MNYRMMIRRDPEENGANGGEPEVKTFDEILKDGYQSEFDKRISKAISTALTKERERLNALHSKELSEAERMAKMTDEEKSKYLTDKKLKDLEEREKAILKRELRATAKGTLAEKKLPAGLADILAYDSEESMNSSITALEQAFNLAVKTAVDEKLKGGKAHKDARTEGDDKVMTDKEKLKAAARNAVHLK